MLALSTEHELGLFGGRVHCVSAAGALAALGNPDEGITLITSGLSLGHGAGFMLNTPMTLTLLADAHRMAGQLQHALENAGRCAGSGGPVTMSGWFRQRRFRLRGDLQILAGDRLAAEVSLL